MKFVKEFGGAGPEGCLQLEGDRALRIILPLSCGDVEQGAGIILCEGTEETTIQRWCDVLGLPRAEQAANQN